MKATIKRTRASSVLVDDKFYDTGKELELSFSEVFRLSRIDHVDAQYETVPYNPDIFASGKAFNFFGDIDMTSGFGGVSYHLLRDSSEKYNISLAGRTSGVQDSKVLSARRKELRQDAGMVWHDQPRDTWNNSPFARNIAIVPFETTLIPKSWITRINAFDALLVPCEQNIQAFKDSGIKIPIELIHWGVDLNQYTPLERPERSTFTFGTMGALSVRKGTDVLIDAFLEAFPDEQDVRLLCKTSFNHYPWMVKDKRIEVQISPVSHQELMSDFFQKVDCFVFPTRGEGFGLTPLEAMATGIPAIVTGWSGPLEYMIPETGWLIDYSMTPATVFTEEVYKEDCGDWAEPSKAHLIELMRNAYENQKEVKKKGQAAAQYVKENWQWNEKIKMYHSALEKHL
jgi:glycosyltransferase involved in cell wall biosynthesis